MNSIYIDKNRKKLEDAGYGIANRGMSILVFRQESSLPEIPSSGPIGEPSPLRGRGQIRRIEPDMVVRNLEHGGAFRHLSGNRFLSCSRTIHEILTSAHLCRNDVPTPEIIAARISRANSPFMNISVISREIPDSVDLLTYIENGGERSGDILEETGRLIRKVHNTNVYHADLHIKNILLDGNLVPWIIDLDKARILKSMPEALKEMSLRRFFRSCIKWQDAGRIELPGDWRERIVSGYSS